MIRCAPCAAKALSFIGGCCDACPGNRCECGALQRVRCDGAVPARCPVSWNPLRVSTSTKDMLYGEVLYPDYQDFRRQATSVSGLVAYETATSRSPRRARRQRHISGDGCQRELLHGARRRAGAWPWLPAQRGHCAVASGDYQSQAVAARVRQRSECHRSRGAAEQRAVTVVGVAPERFGGTELFFHPDLFIPLSAIRTAYPNTPSTFLESARSAGSPCSAGSRLESRRTKPTPSSPCSPNGSRAPIPTPIVTARRSSCQR